MIGVLDGATNQIDADVVGPNDAQTLTQFVHERTKPDTMVFTDEARAYDKLNRPRETVAYDADDFVDRIAHTNGVESFWAVLQRTHYGVYHNFSMKQLGRYVNETAGIHNQRPLDTMARVASLFASGVGNWQRYSNLIGPVEVRQPKLNRFLN